MTMTLTMRAVFRLALRQTEGLIASVVAPMGLALTVPDHSTMCRRSRTLELPPLRRSGTGPLLDQITGPIASFTADGVYDQHSFRIGNRCGNS
jgi:hypothetical protein